MEFEQINNKYNTEFTNKLLQHKHIFYEIYEACGNTFLGGCGSYLFDGQTYKYCDLMYDKQELLYNNMKNVKNVLEIGTYMGHSILIMLLSNPELKITCIDIDNKYTGTAVNILNKYFNNAIKFIHSDSLSALNNILNNTNEKYDFFHVDGHHENNYITKEFNFIKKLNNHPENILRIIFDDQDALPILQKEINIEYNNNIKKQIIPNCRWNNIYFEIQM